MTRQSIEDIGHWHQLFDELCDRAGIYDAASLVAGYCALSDGGDQKQYEAALRNLQNWRSGRHVPRIRSLRILEKLLHIDQDPAIRARWNELYAQASVRSAEASAPRPAADGPPEPERPPSRWAALLPGRNAALAGVLLFVLGAVSGNLWGSGWRPWGSPADNAPIVVYNPDVTFTRGETKVIHAERGDCGKLPRDWIDVEASLPSTSLGTFSDGGLARRNSKFCKGYTPARAILFTAHRAGVEQLKVEGEFIKVTVVEPQDGQENVAVESQVQDDG